MCRGVGVSPRTHQEEPGFTHSVLHKAKAIPAWDLSSWLSSSPRGISSLHLSGQQAHVGNVCAPSEKAVVLTSS